MEIIRFVAIDKETNKYLYKSGGFIGWSLTSYIYLAKHFKSSNFARRAVKEYTGPDSDQHFSVAKITKKIEITLH